MSENNKKNALSLQKNSFYALENTNIDTISAELEGLDLQFEKIKIPSGGGLFFEVPGEGDEPDTVKDFSAVIIYHHPLNAYYKTAYKGGNTPPDCGSYDGIVGIGDPGGVCKTCHLNQYGTGENESKACKNRRRIYLLREGEIFPVLLSLPTGSLKSFTKFLQLQLSKGRASNTVLTKFSLKKAVSKGGISYSQCIFTLDRILTFEEQKAVQKMTEQIKSYARKVEFDPADETIVINAETGEIVEPGGNNV